MSGKIREKSGNFEVDDKWQPCWKKSTARAEELNVSMAMCL